MPRLGSIPERMPVTQDPDQAFARVAASVLQWVEEQPRIRGRDITPVGHTVPMFVGVCAYCDRGILTHLPIQCPVCDRKLKTVSYWIPLALLIFGERYRRWMRFKYAVRQKLTPLIPTPIRMVWSLSNRMADQFVAGRSR